MTRTGPRPESRARRGAGRPAARRAEDARDVRGEILEATGRLLAVRPLEEITVSDVIEEARVSRASFYIYFESKYAPLAALAEQVTEQLYVDSWKTFLDGNEPMSEQQLTQHWLQSLEFWDEHRAVLVAAAAAWRADPVGADGWRAMWSRFVDDTQRFIEVARERHGAPQDLDSHVLAAALVWMNENALYLAFGTAAPQFHDHQRLAETQSGIWFRAIFGTPGR